MGKSSQNIGKKYPNLAFWENVKQASAELGQAQLPTGIWLSFDYHLMHYID